MVIRRPAPRRNKNQRAYARLLWSTARQLRGEDDELPRVVGPDRTVNGELAAGRPVWAWGHQGHETIGAIADALLVGTPAEKEVRNLLGAEKLATAALWADCVKGVGNGAPYHYHLNSRYPECDPFQHSSAGREEMEDYVRRNAPGCHAGGGEELCHKTYHYADVAIEHDSYDRADVGTSDHDVVSAITAAIARLKGQAVPPPLASRARRRPCACWRTW